MAIDLKSLNPAQLDELIKKAESRKHDIKRERVSVVRDKVNKLIKAEGFTFAELFGGKRGGKRGKVAPKYRNPANPDETWSGRGKRPRWFNAALKAGKKDKDLLIK
ncbi:MAG TPA: H-NS histone family protein [Rhodanobacteraceae bacterium]|nr:H-NS histone family protein [Rhodanobacteraceae bacterium]